MKIYRLFQLRRFRNSINSSTQIEPHCTFTLNFDPCAIRLPFVHQVHRYVHITKYYIIVRLRSKMIIIGLVDGGKFGNMETVVDYILILLGFTFDGVDLYVTSVHLQNFRIFFFASITNKCFLCTCFHSSSLFLDFQLVCFEVWVFVLQLLTYKF